MKTVTTLLGLLLCATLWSNNLQISNASIVQRDNTNDQALIQFDIGWENSWRDAENWDASWVVVKYRLQGTTGAWSHATLDATGHVAVTGSTIDPSSDGLGAFIYRDAVGSGTASWTNMQLRWNYGVDGLTDNDEVEVKVVGIEMVYVPAGSYWLGDGENRGADQVFGNFELGATGNPFQVTSEGAITLGGSGAGSLGNNNKESMYCCDQLLDGDADDFDDATTQTLAAEFPKGFDAFYCMKYEITQDGFVTMINMVDATQAALIMETNYFVNNANPPSHFRYGISGTHPNVTTSEPYIPLIYLDWEHGAPYADWLALRPMTELEFEKSCRGTATPVIGEYPWGTADIDLSDSQTLANRGAINESLATGYTVDPSLGNCHVRAGSQNLREIMRVGIFAADANNVGRVTSGASYWGIFELGGNAWERCISVGHPEGRKFQGTHGDGELLPNGRASNPDWPGTSGSGVESNHGMGYRGAGFDFPTPFLERNARTSNRRLATAFWNITLFDDSMRFVRNAP